MNFWNRLKFAFSFTEVTEKFFDGMNFREDLKQKNPLRIFQLHALLSKAIEENPNCQFDPVEIQLEYVQGSMCGMPHSTIESAEITYSGLTGKTLRLVPMRSLMHISEQTFRDAVRLDMTYGPHS